MADSEKNASPEFIAYMKKRIGEEAVVQDSQIVPGPQGVGRMALSGTLAEVLPDAFVLRAANGEVVMHYGTYYAITFPSRIKTGLVS
jgi:hypothetical protein